MNLATPVGLRRPTNELDIRRRTEHIIEGVTDHNDQALHSFAEHLIEEGLLGCGLEELTLGKTVRQLVIEYLATRDGKAEMKAWARGLAEEQLEEGVVI